MEEKNQKTGQRWHHEKDSVQLSFPPDIAGFEDGGRGPRAKEYRGPLEAGKGKETDPLLEFPAKNAVLPKA